RRGTGVQPPEPGNRPLPRAGAAAAGRLPRRRLTRTGHAAPERPHRTVGALRPGPVLLGAPPLQNPTRGRRTLLLTRGHCTTPWPVKNTIPAESTIMHR